MRILLLCLLRTIAFWRGYLHIDRTSDPRLDHDPGHPDANPETGYVEYPAINAIDEMADMMLASRAYEANTVAIQMTRQMAEQTLRLLQ